MAGAALEGAREAGARGRGEAVVSVERRLEEERAGGKDGGVHAVEDTSVSFLARAEAASLANAPLELIKGEIVEMLPSAAPKTPSPNPISLVFAGARSRTRKGTPGPKTRCW